MSPDIEKPAFEIAIGSGENRRIAERLRISRQYQFFERRPILGMNHIDDWNGCLFGAASQTGSRRHTSRNAPTNCVSERTGACCEGRNKNQCSGQRDAIRILGCLSREILSAYSVHSCHCLTPQVRWVAATFRLGFHGAKWRRLPDRRKELQPWPLSARR